MTARIHSGSMDDYPLTLTSIVEYAERFHGDRKVVSRRPRWGERPLAVVSLCAGAEASPNELREHLAQEFAKWQLPERFEFVAAIPCTATGKFKKTELRDQFASV